MPVYRVDPTDIERSAHGIIRFFGADAEQVAISLVRKYERAKDIQAQETWTAIARTIRRTVSKEPTE